jgi:hydroxymethylpyrimidine/phosphomethylpyrimidine kinase
VANLALGYPPLTATAHAKDYLTSALRYALTIGAGQGPVGHFFPLFEGCAIMPLHSSVG